MIKDGVAIGTLQASQLKRFPSEQYKCFMQIRHHPPTHILTGAVVRLNQYVSPHHPRIAYSQIRSCKIWRKRQNHHIRIAKHGWHAKCWRKFEERDKTLDCPFTSLSKNAKSSPWIADCWSDRNKNHPTAITASTSKPILSTVWPQLGPEARALQLIWLIHQWQRNWFTQPLLPHTIPYHTKSRGLSLVLYHTIHPEPRPTQTVTLHLPYTGPPLNGLQWHPIRIWFFLTL